MKLGKDLPKETFATAAATALGLDTIVETVKVSGELGLTYCFGADEFILDDIRSPQYADCRIAHARMLRPGHLALM